MAFRYGPAGETVELPDSPNPQTIALLGECKGVLGFIAAADAQDSLPPGLKESMRLLRDKIDAHITRLSEPARS